MRSEINRLDLRQRALDMPLNYDLADGINVAIDTHVLVEEDTAGSRDASGN